MSRGSKTLIPVPLDETNRDLLSNFDGGPTRYGAIATEWIKGPHLNKSLARGNLVWAYLDPEDNPVGYASLGKARWAGLDISYIAMLGVDVNAQGKPPASSCRDRYCGQIVAHLIQEASKFNLPVLGLHCAPDNIKALRLYAEFGFTALATRDRHGNLCMARKMPSEPSE